MNEAGAFSQNESNKSGSFVEASSEMLRVLVDSVTEYAIFILDPQGTVVSWSPAAEKLNGYRSDEIIGKHFSTFYPPEDVAKGKTEAELEQALRQGKFEDEGWRVRKDGTRFWANVIITALRGSAGQLLGFGKVVRDLSERRRAEQAARDQAREILEMATVPVVQVWGGIMLVPLIGMLDSARTQQLMERLLQRLTETASPVALIDITGVPTVDTQTAQHLVETIKAVRYIGADVVLTGVRPAIAQTMVHLGIDLSGVTTRSSLSSGLKVALGLLNLQITELARAA